MPRKTKETIEKETNLKSTEKQPKKPTTLKSAKKSNTTNKKNVTKKTTSKKTSSASTKTSTVKKSTTAKRSTSNTKKSSTVKKTTKKSIEPTVVEYYDLPYRYNQTIVKLLAQTPKTLFIYWDISDKDRENYKTKYGENFFETTKPILIVHNDTLGYSFEVEINDFANSWYLHVSDSKCDYRIELGRKPIINTKKLNINDYIYITMSNAIESPNDKILFNKNQNMVYFKNIKTNEQSFKSIANISFLSNMGKIYNIYDLYQAIYKDENIEDFYSLSNPSSGNPSSNIYS